MWPGLSRGLSGLFRIEVNWTSPDLTLPNWSPRPCLILHWSQSSRDWYFLWHTNNWNRKFCHYIVWIVLQRRCGYFLIYVKVELVCNADTDGNKLQGSAFPRKLIPEWESQIICFPSCSDVDNPCVKPGGNMGMDRQSQNLTYSSWRFQSYDAKIQDVLISVLQKYLIYLAVNLNLKPRTICDIHDNEGLIKRSSLKNKWVWSISLTHSWNRHWDWDLWRGPRKSHS